MTPENRLLAHIATAEAHVRIAREVWDPSSISACAQCGAQLQQAISEMSAASEAVGAGPAPAGSQARLNRLRADVEGLSRLVDAAIAFGRGLALRSAGVEPAGSEREGYVHG